MEKKLKKNANCIIMQYDIQLTRAANANQRELSQTCFEIKILLLQL